MLNSQLLQLFQILTKEELRQLTDYIQSPFFNKSKLVIKLFFLIKKEYPTFSKNQLNKEKIALLLFPNKQDKAKALRQLMSRLGILIKGFLTQQALSKNKEYTDFYMLQELAERQNIKLFTKSFNKIKNNQAKKKEKRVDHYFHDYLLEHIQYEHNFMDTQQGLHSDLQELMHKFDVFFILTKLQHYVSLITRGNVITITTKMPFLTVLLSVIDTSDSLKSIPLIHLYHTLIQLFHSQSKVHFFKLKTLLLQHHTSLPKVEEKTIYDQGINYCISQLKQGNSDYLYDMFTLYQAMSKNQLLTLQGYIHPQDFKNIIAVSVKLKEFMWVKEFIQDFQQHLPKSLKKNMLHYALGVLYFYEAKYSTALTELRQVTLLNFMYYLDMEGLLIKTYYELAEVISLESKLDAFRKYLQRNTTMSDNNKEAYYNFIKLTKRLNHWKEKANFAKHDSKIKNSVQHGLEKLLKNIETCQPLVNKKWLSEKANLEQQKFTTIKTDQTT